MKKRNLWVILTGVVIWFGRVDAHRARQPRHMGFCIAVLYPGHGGSGRSCIRRMVVQYVRPEIVGMIAGS
jgi:hypothetical protein